MVEKNDDETLGFHKPEGLLSYNSYLKVPQLLELQEHRSEPPAHDELLFIIIHQAYELWFKQILFEVGEVRERLESDDILEATRLMKRVTKIEELLVQQIHILETMTPRDFLSFRSALNPASGFQSIQFRELEFACGLKHRGVMEGIELTDEDVARLEQRLEEPSVRRRLYEALQRRDFDVVVPGDTEELEGEELERTMAELERLYANPGKFYHVYELCETLVDHDQKILMWRFHHVRVVERLIGTKMGTGGSPGVKYLETTLQKRMFPMLWAARGRLSDEEFYGTSRGPTTYLDETD